MVLNKTYMYLVGAAVLASLVVACGTSGPEKADSIEDIAGTWKRVGGGTGNYCRYHEDGTYGCDRDLERVNNNSASFKGEYSFEDAHYLDEIWICSEVGVYEILLLESGNIKFELIEDVCSGRVSDIVGSGSSEGKIEWEPVP